MAMSNQELVEKAGAILSSSLASGGKLNPQQADRFIDFVFDESMLDGFARIERFRNEQLDIDKIGVGQRVAVPADEGIDPGIRRGVNTSKVTLQPQEIMLPSEIGDTFKEHNIEGDNVVETILQLFARQLANDLEELYIHGNTGGILQSQFDLNEGSSTTLFLEDSYLKLFNGFLQKAQSGNVVDIGGAAISANVFRQMLSAMPTKFKRNKNRLKWLVPTGIEEIWRERLASRATGLGDRALTEDGNIMVWGIEMIPVPLMELNPLQTQSTAFTGSGSTIQLDFAPILDGSVVVMDEADAATGQPHIPYVDPTDYTVDATAGTITHAGGGSSIGATDTVRITYRSMPQILLVLEGNLIIAFGRDIRMERDREIFRRVDQFATTVKVDTQYEEDTAVVVANNVSDQL